jgi:putative heme transporter
MILSCDVAMPDPTPRVAPRGWSRGRRHILMAVLVGLVAYVAISVAGGLTDGIGALERADVGWLVAALAAEVAAYLLLAAQLRRVIGPDVDLPAGTACRLALILCGFGCVTPASPAEGMMITGTELCRRGLSTRRTAVTLGVAELVSAVAMAALAAINVFAAASFADLPSGTVLPLLGAAVVTLIAVGIADLVAGRRQVAEWTAVVVGALCFWRPQQSVAACRATGAAWHAEATSVLGSPANRAALLTISAAAWVADVCCCYCALAAFGITVPFDVVLLAYTIGVLATLVPFVPAGFGLVETAMPLVLQGFGVPLASAVAAVIVYRCVSTLLPAAVGLACIPRRRVHRREPPPTAIPALVTSRAA